jgi:transposase
MQSVGRRQRFVPIKSAEQQAALLLHRTRDLLIRQRSSLISSIRAHFAQFGIVARRGVRPLVWRSIGVLLAGQCDILVRSRIGVPWDQAKAGLGHTGSDSVDECLLP